LPTSEEYNWVLVVVDRYSKYATFIPAPKECSAEQAAHLFFKHVVKYWGLPRSIISDRDTRFTGRFWTELFKLMGSELNFSTSFHPQSDGQTERVNALLEIYLRHYVSANQRDWAKLLDVAQFSYNLQKSESTGRSPFEVVTGQQPLTPSSLAISYKGPSPPAYRFAKDWNDQVGVARAYLEKASQKMKKWADKKRRPREFQVGDLVLVKMYNHARLGGRHRALIRRYEGPFPILKKVGAQAYKVELPPKLKYHPVFHVSLLKPYHGDQEDPSRGISHRAPMGIQVQHDKEVEEILADRVVRHSNQPPTHELLVRWKGLPDSEASWEPIQHLWQFKRQIEEYEDMKATRTSPD